MLKTFGVIFAVVLLAACGSPKIRPAVGLPATAAGLVAGAGHPYSIDSAQSEVRLLVYRAGPMARLGHNHVIVNRALSGWVDPPGANFAGWFSMQMPVATFVVDDARSRAAAGSDFSEVVSEDAKAGTLHNMLGAALLDGDRFPLISLASVAIVPATDGTGAVVATLLIAVAGHESQVRVPFTLVRSAGRLAASGTTVLRQSELGLTPFSVMLGALQVQDEITVEFDVVALAG